MPPLNIPDRTNRPPSHQIKEVDLPEANWQVLPNGMKVVLLKTGTQKVVRTEFIYPAGKWFEPSAGTAAATASMLLEGTKTKKSKQIARTIDSLGSYLSPFSEADRAGLTLFSLSRNFQPSLELTVDLIKNSIFPPSELELYSVKSKEWLLVKREQVSYLGNEGFLKMLFGRDHPYGRSVDISDFEQMDQNRVVTYFKQSFRNIQPAVIISGNWNFDILQLINHYFGTFEPPKNLKATGHLNYAHQSPENLVIPKKDALQSAIFVGKATINRKHADFNGLKIVTTLLGGYFGSRLMKNIREEKGYTYGISARLISLEHSGYFVISSEVNSKVVKPALTEIYNEIKRLREEPVTRKELQLVINYLMGSWLSLFDGPFSQAESYRILMDYELDESYFQNAVSDLQSITPDRIQSLANKYLQEDSLITVIAGKS